MNTRLQVEHPVTEAVTGVDLVRAQLLVAGGAPLPWRQSALSQRGHAIECRIYAEDPLRDFLPQAGRLLMYREPKGPGIRVDSGVVEGAEVSVYYDPMLAKLIVSAETRRDAVARAVMALKEFIVLGLRTNIPFLLAILDHPRFVKGHIDTAFLDSEAVSLETALDRAVPAAAVAAAAFHRDDLQLTARLSPAVDPFETLREWRNS
jgi:acetyl/propionyl-CoA carboxylase alpha subunit